MREVDENGEELTRSDVITRTTPMGMNVKPMIKKIGRAVFAVMIGCQAGKRCCLKAVSETMVSRKQTCHESETTSFNEPAGFLLFCCSRSSSCSAGVDMFDYQTHRDLQERRGGLPEQQRDFPSFHSLNSTRPPQERNK